MKLQPLFWIVNLGVLAVTLIGHADDCSTVSSERAFQAFNACAHKGIFESRGYLNKNAVVIDADRKCMWVLKNGSPILSTSIAESSFFGPQTGHSPLGLMETCNKITSNVFSTPDQFICLRGEDLQNNTAWSRGVYLHGIGEQTTHGCFDMIPSTFGQVKNLLNAADNQQKAANGVTMGTPVFVYSGQMTGDGCDGHEEPVGQSRETPPSLPGSHY